jgi:hypothetical protein
VPGGVPGGVEVEAVIREGAEQMHAKRKIERALEARGVPVRRLNLVTDPARLRNPFPLRGDLRETSFSAPRGRRYSDGTDGAGVMRSGIAMDVVAGRTPGDAQPPVTDPGGV